MNIQASDIVVGLMMAVLGLAGLVLAAGALDNEIYVFGLSLAGFACLFILGQVRRHFDETDAARLAGTADAALATPTFPARAAATAALAEAEHA